MRYAALDAWASYAVGMHIFSQSQQIILHLSPLPPSYVHFSPFLFDFFLDLSPLTYFIFLCLLTQLWQDPQMQMQTNSKGYYTNTRMPITLTSMLLYLIFYTSSLLSPLYPSPTYSFHLSYYFLTFGVGCNQLDVIVHMIYPASQWLSTNSSGYVGVLLIDRNEK